MNYNQQLFDFIESSPSCFHAITNVMETLTKDGFTRLYEKDSWGLEPGGKYFVTSNTSSIIAFVIPEQEFQGFHMVASHSDFPTFKLKANPEVRTGDTYTTLSVERYGGPLMAPWFDRPLSIAGRIVVAEHGEPVEKLVDFGADCISIVNLAIHMNRTVNDGYGYKMSKDMMPIWAGAKNEKGFMSELAQVAQVKEEEILDMDLYLYNRMDATTWGVNKEFISAPKLDDLQCAFASMTAFLKSKSDNYVNVMAIFDNEEVGSGTRQGAKSTFLSSILKRVAEGKVIMQYECHNAQDNVVREGAGLAFNMEENYGRLVANSFLLSADNAHAFHPNYPEKADSNNRIHPNGGVVIKYTASQQYTTDAMSGAYVKLLCKEAGVDYQMYFNHSDVVGGSTLGNLAVGQIPMPAADIGAAQLAMHSPYETAGVQDTQDLVELMTTFYNK